MRIIASLSALLMASCAIDPHAFNGPSGRPAYSMQCSGFGRTLSACYRKAGQLCPLGYNVVDLTTGTIVVPVNNSIMAGPKYHLAIECR